MKFEEKLINLRKKSLLSQEELAEKLGVTRQTISKWELGQSKPDMDKLIEMSKLFNVDMNILTNENSKLDENNKTKVKKKKEGRKFLLYIFVLIFIAALVTLTYRVSIYVKEKVDIEKEKVKEEEKKEKEIAEKIKKEWEDTETKNDISSFNRDFEFYNGTITGSRVSTLIDEIITNNKKNDDKLIEFIFDGVSYGTDPESIRQNKDKIKTFKDSGFGFQDYEVILDYNNNGYINKITIETK